tara:strand:+ start:1225 stop:1425 length:201 start_codon:yes stop_codon:yes gene_type:complete
MNFETMVKKQEEIERLKRDNKALIERLSASHKAMDKATDYSLEEEINILLISELAPNEELLERLKP